MERCYTSKLELPKQIKDDFTISDCFKAEIRAIYGLSIISGFTHLFLNNPITRKIMIGVTTVPFGVSHVHNFTEINKNVMKLVVLHQTISGAILAYVAIQIGLRYAMAMHIAFDLVCYGKQVYEKRPIRSSTFLM